MKTLSTRHFSFPGSDRPGRGVNSFPATGPNQDSEKEETKKDADDALQLVTKDINFVMSKNN